MVIIECCLDYSKAEFGYSKAVEPMEVRIIPWLSMRTAEKWKCTTLDMTILNTALQTILFNRTYHYNQHMLGRHMTGFGGVDNLAMSFSAPNKVYSNKRRGIMEVQISYISYMNQVDTCILNSITRR